jgi:hypothetical protein
MRDYQATYTELLSRMRDSFPLGEHPVGGTYIEYPGNGFNRICLYEPNHTPPGTFALVIYAGDTCNQARALFKHFSYEKAMTLQKLGWTTRSSFHFAWQRKNIIFLTGHETLALSEYIDYWKSPLGKGYMRKYHKNEFEMLLKGMRDANIMDEEDITKFNDFFRRNKYQSATTCPGIINQVSYSKERLNEDIETLAGELKEKLMSLLEIYG